MLLSAGEVKNTAIKKLFYFELRNGLMQPLQDLVLRHPKVFAAKGKLARGINIKELRTGILKNAANKPCGVIKRLLRDIAAAYARQLPKKHSGVEERFSRQFNYPDKRRVKSAEDLPKLGIKTFFCSNVCAAYRREIYDSLGGFVQRAIFNEDMIYASAVIRNGYKIAYEAQAGVYHSHDYTNMQKLHRNFDLGVSQAEHPEVFADVPSESEGGKMVKAAAAYFKQQKKWYRLPHFYVQCAFKYAGYFLGKHYKKLPKSWILRFTSNREYWK